MDRGPLGVEGGILRTSSMASCLTLGAVDLNAGISTCTVSLARFHWQLRDPLVRVPGQSQTILILLAILGGLICFWLVRQTRSFMTATIRQRLFASFMVVVLLPALAFAMVGTVVGYRSGRQQVIDQLESVATIKEAELNTWVGNVQTDLYSAVLSHEVVQDMRLVLAPSRHPSLGHIAYENLHGTFDQVVAESPRIDEFFLMDLRRRVVLSTDARREGKSGGPDSNIYFYEGLKGPYLYPPSYHLSVGGIAVVAVRPVYDERGEVLGVVGARAGPEGLTEIMLERAGLGHTGETYLVTTSYVVLTEPRVRPSGWSRTVWAFTEGAKKALSTQTNGSGVYQNYNRVPVIGVYHWLPELGLALIAEQGEAEAMSSVYATLGIYLGVTVIAATAAAVLSLAVARTIAGPLSSLAEMATRVAEGDLDRLAPVEREDEIGALAEAFNSMTKQVRDLIGGLERRVRERTQALREANEALRRRALQLETSAEVSRDITSILDINELLDSVVRVIRDAFGYHHVHIYLVDEDGKQLIMRASTGSGRPDLGHLDLEGGGVNALAVRTGQAVRIDDVTRDERYALNEHLHDVQSELVVPLHVGTQVIGTLNVEGSKAGAFGDEDVLVIQSLGDQIAIAIQNARLYDHSRELATLEERHRLARELHDSVTQSLFSLDLHAKAIGTYLKQNPGAAEEKVHQLRRITQDTLREMRSVIFDLRPSALQDSNLEAALRQEVERLSRADGPEITLEVTGSGVTSSAIEQALLRIAQEALHNAVEHAHAEHIAVSVEALDDRVRLLVSDDGWGFDPASARCSGRGFGLVGMRERAEELDGSLEIVSRRGEGCRVAVWLPTH
jgi:nitrate/nitrite-specific signal transduction histidine kinase